MMHYKDRPEAHIEIPLKDGKSIHAIVRGELAADTPAVIMMHGRPGSANELLQYLGARYLSERGITTVRLSMYDFGPSYRSILDCTLDTHITDFEDAVSYVRDAGVQKVFALGHSYGGITILGSKAQLDGAVLWDPSHGLAWHNDNPEFKNPKFPKKECEDMIIGTGGQGYVYAKRQDEYDRRLGDTTKWAKDKAYPMKFILASAGPLAKYAQRYYDIAPEPKALVGISDAHHQFEDSDAVMEQLFAETANWIEHYKD